MGLATLFPHSLFGSKVPAIHRFLRVVLFDISGKQIPQAPFESKVLVLGSHNLQRHLATGHLFGDCNALQKTVLQTGSNESGVRAVRQ